MHLWEGTGVCVIWAGSRIWAGLRNLRDGRASGQVFAQRSCIWAGCATVVRLGSGLRIWAGVCATVVCATLARLGRCLRKRSCVCRCLRMRIWAGGQVGIDGRASGQVLRNACAHPGQWFAQRSCIWACLRNGASGQWFAQRSRRVRNAGFWAGVCAPLAHLGRGLRNACASLATACASGQWFVWAVVCATLARLGLRNGVCLHRLRLRDGLGRVCASLARLGRCDGLRRCKGCFARVASGQVFAQRSCIWAGVCATVVHLGRCLRNGRASGQVFVCATVVHLFGRCLRNGVCACLCNGRASGQVVCASVRVSGQVFAQHLLFWVVVGAMLACLGSGLRNACASGQGFVQRLCVWVGVCATVAHMGGWAFARSMLVRMAWWAFARRMLARMHCWAFARRALARMAGWAFARMAGRHHTNKTCSEETRFLL